MWGEGGEGEMGREGFVVVMLGVMENCGASRWVVGECGEEATG